MKKQKAEVKPVEKTSGTPPTYKGQIRTRDTETGEYRKLGKIALWENPLSVENSKAPILRGNLTIDGHKAYVSLWEYKARE